MGRSQSRKKKGTKSFCFRIVDFLLCDIHKVEAAIFIKEKYNFWILWTTPPPPKLSDRTALSLWSCLNAPLANSVSTLLLFPPLSDQWTQLQPCPEVPLPRPAPVFLCSCWWVVPDAPVKVSAVNRVAWRGQQAFLVPSRTPLCKGSL